MKDHQIVSTVVVIGCSFVLSLAAAGSGMLDGFSSSNSAEDGHRALSDLEEKTDDRKKGEDQRETKEGADDGREDADRRDDRRGGDGGERCSNDTGELDGDSRRV